MLRCAKFKGDWNEYYNDYRWHKLTVAARHIGYRFEEDAHRALADCQATRAVWQHMETDSLLKRAEKSLPEDFRKLPRPADPNAAMRSAVSQEREEGW